MLGSMTAEPAWIGHLYLQPADAPAAADDDAITIAWDGKALAPRSLLALRMLSPLAALPLAERAKLRVLLAGEVIAGASEACKAIGCAKVQEGVSSSAALQANYHRVLIGCGSARPSWVELQPLVAQLRQEGQLGVIGLPAKELPELQRELSEHGFSLRAAGTEASLGFLAGSIENPDQFKS